jgi:glycogen debranching enzyme
VLCTEDDGSIEGGQHGLFYRDTRVLSRHQLTVGGQRPTLIAGTQPENDEWMGVYQVSRPGGTPDGPLLPQDALEITVRRVLGPGMVESIRISNHSGVACPTELRLSLDGDFADLAELKGERRQEGVISRDPEGADTLRMSYDVSVEGRADQRGLRITADGILPLRIDPREMSFDLDLEPGGTVETTLRYAVLDRHGWHDPTTEHERRARQRQAWRRRRPVLSRVEVLGGPFERAADDLFDLRNWELEEQLLDSTSGAAWVVNAGVPMFTGLFGRDVITAGWQSALLGPRAAAGALDAIAATQATEDDPWRDAEPGKLIHELRTGPLAALGLTPRDAYYGSQTTPAMFLLALSELWHWTGDDDVLRRHIGVARRAMDWARRFGDLDGDGFLEYRKRAPLGLRNQAWKDSDEAIRHADGSIAEGPIATVEEQAFYFLALQRMAEILFALDDNDAAEDCLHRAEALRGRWHEAFWLDREGFYAMALDGEKKTVASIGSNPGHALGAGIVPPDHAGDVADRLLAPDLFSGWGVRTLSDQHPSYNPFAYHLGSVWPVEQATFALGFKRYGLDEHLDRLAGAVFEAAFASEEGRLPEALAGLPRGDVPAPVPYPAANVPQAWSASALVQLVQIMLGLYPFAPLRVLAVVRPRLPAWAPELRLAGLRVGKASVDLEFRRRDDGSASWRVTRRRGPLLVIGAGPPNAASWTWSERLKVSALDRAPGRLVRAARLAIGRV